MKNLKVKFYASSVHYRNKLFVFKITGLDKMNDILEHFVKNGNKIHSAWLQYELNNGLVSQTRFGQNVLDSINGKRKLSFRDLKDIH